MELFMEKQPIVGTNCYNCLYITKDEVSIDLKELNSQGGIDPDNDEDMERAKKADLITLPSTKQVVTGKKFCNNENVLVLVTSRMCCIYWDNKGARRPWIKHTPEPHYIDQIF
jgi:hypothetical protein